MSGNVGSYMTQFGPWYWMTVRPWLGQAEQGVRQQESMIHLMQNADYDLT